MPAAAEVLASRGAESVAACASVDGPHSPERTLLLAQLEYLASAAGEVLVDVELVVDQLHTRTKGPPVEEQVVEGVAAGAATGGRPGHGLGLNGEDAVPAAQQAPDQPAA